MVVLFLGTISLINAIIDVNVVTTLYPSSLNAHFTTSTENYDILRIIFSDGLKVTVLDVLDKHKGHILGEYHTEKSLITMTNIVPHKPVYFFTGIVNRHSGVEV
jgi:hypothetical protein